MGLVEVSAFKLLLPTRVQPAVTKQSFIQRFRTQVSIRFDQDCIQ
jgi:hypothetical protein